MAGPDPLEKYRAKRDFERTSEPSGRAANEDHGPDGARAPELPEGVETGVFCVQQHDATRLHWDVRVEVDGILRAWAVPRGPSYDPAVKRLAVPTEDHPMEYLDYEGNIPSGAYGGGPSLLWDMGTYVNISHDRQGRIVALAKALEKGHVSIWFQGEKLQGGWALTRIQDRTKDGVTWLMVKRADATADPDRDIVVQSPRSVKSGLTVEELRASGVG
jgi:DNA ligase D-like protein (predicted 3'-phosphoesterase)